MDNVITIALAPSVRESPERAAAAEGLTLDAFVLRAAEQRARYLGEAQAFFAERAQGAEAGAAKAFFTRPGKAMSRVEALAKLAQIAGTRPGLAPFI